MKERKKQPSKAIEAIRSERIAWGISQAELASKAGLKSSNYLSQLETGHRAKPAHELVESLQQALAALKAEKKSPSSVERDDVNGKSNQATI